MIFGSTSQNDKNYSTINIGSDITLEGWSGIFINHNNNTAYGILINMNGTINAINDINENTGIGIYINGNIQHENNYPIINLNNTTKIYSTGTGIYSAGYATYYINGAYIEGTESAIGIKSGIFNILDGTIIGTGPDKTPTPQNNNGINASGTAIQIESNPNYKGNIELNIKNGTLKSKNSNVIYEYTVNNSTQIKKLNISGGTFISEINKDVFLLSNNLKNTYPKFISGGTFSSNPTNYLLNGYSTTLNKDSLYEITNNTITSLDTTKTIETTTSNKKNILKKIIIIIITIILIIIIYINNIKLIKLFNFIKNINK